MRPAHAPLPLLAAFFALTAATHADDPKPFEVPGYFRVDSPGPGYAWKAVKTVDLEGTRTRVFACVKEGSKSRVVITMQEKTTDTDARRSTAIKGHHNGMVETLKKGGFTAISGEPPSLKKPVANSVPFTIAANGPDGTAYTLKSATIFKKNTYLFQVSSDVRAEAERLFKLAETIREEKAVANSKKVRR
jgi:hypothetical protein